MMSPATETGRSSLGSSKHGSSLSVAVCNGWKLCGSDLSSVYEGLLHQAAILFGASVNGSWNESTTHVIVPTFEYGTCCRSLKVLKAIMCGQWIITIDWIKACIQARGPVPEEPYEVIRVGVELLYDSYGPKKGRFRAIKKEPKIFVGFRFYLGNQFDDPLDRCLLEDVIAAAGGSILGPHDLSSESSHTKLSSLGSSYIVVNEKDPWDENGVLNDELSKERGREVARVEHAGGTILQKDELTCSSAELSSLESSYFVVNEGYLEIWSEFEHKEGAMERSDEAVDMKLKTGLQGIGHIQAFWIQLLHATLKLIDLVI